MCINSSLLFVAEKYIMIRLYHSVFNHSLTGGHTSRSQFCAVMSKAAIKIHGQVFV